MKNQIKFVMLSCILAFTSSCEQDGELQELSNENAQTVNTELAVPKKLCPSHDVYLSMLAKNPEMYLEEERLNALASEYASKLESGKKADEEIEIPVVVHIVYNTPEQNIKWSKVKAQIAALNRDFNAENEDLSRVPRFYKKRVANVGIKFKLVRITRTKTKVVEWLNDAEGIGIFDITLSDKGGKRITDPNKYLNLYIGNIELGFAGIALSPSGRQKYPERDAVIVNVNEFLRDTDEFLGRTAVHEVGHWLNLYHLSGLASSLGCSKLGGDMVSDTPKQSFEYLGFAPYPDARSCNTSDMTMNFMQSVVDSEMYMFTNGQKNRMRANFEPGGSRETFK